MGILWESQESLGIWESLLGIVVIPGIAGISSTIFGVIYLLQYSAFPPPSYTTYTLHTRTHKYTPTAIMKTERTQLLSIKVLITS